MSASKQEIADAAKVMLAQLHLDRVQSSYWRYRWTDVGPMQGDDGGIEAWLLSVVECFDTPPVRVGDLVTSENIDRLPEWSIIAAPRCGARVKLHGRWHMEGNDPASNAHAATFSARVLRIGTGENA